MKTHFALALENRIIELSACVKSTAQRIQNGLTMASSTEDLRALAELTRALPSNPSAVLEIAREITRNRRMDQQLAAAVSVVFGLIVAFLGYFDHDWLAGSIAVSTIIGLATVLGTGKEAKQQQQKEPLKRD